MNHMIPPLIPGFEEAGGLEGARRARLPGDRTGDPELAAEYMRKAGYESGKCEGECEMTMVGDDAPPGRDTAEVFQGQLEDLGFKVASSQSSTRSCTRGSARFPSQQPDALPERRLDPGFQRSAGDVRHPVLRATINP